MSTTITHSTGTITPTSMPEWESEAPARSIVHTILNRPDPDITKRPTGLRRGTLTLVFATGAAAYAARAILAVPQVLTLANSDVPQVGMKFVVADGDISDVYGQAKEWTLTVPFQEVTP